MFKRNYIFVLLVDLGLMLGSLALALDIKYGSVTKNLWNDHVQYFLPVYIFTLFLFYLYSLYTRQAFRSRYWLAVRICSALLISFIFAVIYLYFQPELNITPRRFLLGNYALITASIILWRWALKTVFSKSIGGLNILFLGDGSIFSSLQSEINSVPHLGFNRIINFDSEKNLKLSELVSKFNITHVVLGPKSEVDSKITSELIAILPMGLVIQPYLEFYEHNFGRIPARSLNHGWFINTFKYQRKPIYDFFKRAVDVVFGAIGMVLNTILFPFIFTLIKLDSPGPLFFKGVRVGKNGRQFEIVKYRTMTVWDGADWAKTNDSRITRVGKFLRRSRIDELPQFWNILVGHMALVGPRPEQPHIVQNLSKEIPFYDQRHLIKCGLTGWAQINSGYASTVEESITKFEHDLYYVKNRSLAFDLEIIAHTLKIIFGLKGR